MTHPGKVSPPASPASAMSQVFLVLGAMAASWEPSALRRIFSGIQPTGLPTLGNYLGALRPWARLQRQQPRGSTALYCVVDLHAITVPYDPRELPDAVLDTTAAILASGVRVGESVAGGVSSSLFVQSAVPSHAELAWLLACRAPLGWLRRMTQFKDKSRGE